MRERISLLLFLYWAFIFLNKCFKENVRTVLPQLFHGYFENWVDADADGGSFSTKGVSVVIL